jgi:hypothetical protein
MKIRITSLITCAALLAVALPSVGAEVLRLSGHTDLPGYSGDFDHFE